jgi:hypothetical protein
MLGRPFAGSDLVDRYAWRPRNRRKRRLAAAAGWGLTLLGLGWLVISALVGLMRAAA